MVKLTHEAVEQGLPTEKIRQKLVLEGAEPDAIDLVLHGQQGMSPIAAQTEPSSPCTSPQRRQLSARWVCRADRACVEQVARGMSCGWLFAERPRRAS